MPFYDYYCPTCGETQEIEQRITEMPLFECPICGGQQFKRLISQSSFHLVGRGWPGKDGGGSNGKH